MLDDRRFRCQTDSNRHIRNTHKGRNKIRFRESKRDRERVNMREMAILLPHTKHTKEMCGINNQKIYQKILNTKDSLWFSSSSSSPIQSHHC